MQGLAIGIILTSAYLTNSNIDMIATDYYYAASNRKAIEDLQTA